jgi:PAS domain-containing protein
MHKVISKRVSSFYIDIPALRPGTVEAYAFAFVSAGVATALRIALDPYVVGVQFITFFPAIVTTTVISGFGAGFFCVVLSTAAADFFVLSPRWSFNVEDPAVVANLLLFGPLASYCVIVIARTRFAIEREQAEANKDRLQLALDAAQLGWWQYDPVNRVVLWWDRRVKAIFDVAEDKTEIEEFTKRVHPDDVERVWVAIEAALDPTDPKPYAIDYRVQRGDARSDVWRPTGLRISRVHRGSDALSAWSVPLRTLPNARSARNGSTSLCARSIIAPTTCSAS